MKKTFIFAVILACSFASAMAQQAKYVFYFIGDGMGLNQVNTTEFYRASVKGNLGIDPMCFASFPYTTFATSYSASSDVTDSILFRRGFMTATNCRMPRQRFSVFAR